MSIISLPILLLLSAMLSIQYGSSLAKNLFPFIGPMGATSVRLAFASIMLLIFWRPWREPLDREGIKRVVLYGASLGCMNLFFFLSLERVPLGIAVALEFMGPLVVSIYSSKKKQDYVWAFLAFLGILLLLPESGQDKGLDPVGIFFALVSGLFWGLYIVFGQRAGKMMKGGTAAAWGMLVAATIAVPVGLLTSQTLTWSPQVFSTGLLVALLSSAIPYSLEMFALRRLPRKTFGVLMSLEPALGALMGLFYLGEMLSLLQWLAISLVILSSAGSSYSA